MGFIKLAPAQHRAFRRGAAALVGTVGLSMSFGTVAATAAAPGALNSSFIDGGTLITQIGLGTSPSTYGGGVAVASNGDIYQVGSATTSTSSAELYITRRLPSGELDPSFGTDGTTYENVGAGTAPATALPTGPFTTAADVVLAANGDPIVYTDATTAAGAPQLAILEFTTTGQLNSSFAAGGVYEENVGGKASLPGGVAVESNGDIVFTGSFEDSSYDDHFFAGCLTSDGGVDTGFGTNGLFEPTLGSPSTSTGLDVISQSNGDLAFDAYTDVTTGAIAVVRATASGQLDTSFGTDGVAYIADSTPVPTSSGLSTTPDGGYAIAGSTTSPSSSSPVASVFRLTANGQTDTGFGNDGTALVPATTLPLGVATAVFVQPDGKLTITGLGADLIAGGTQPFVARLNADGSVDSGFGADGVSVNPVTTSTTASLAYPAGAAETPDGNLVLSGMLATASSEAFLQEVTLDTAPTVAFVYAPASVQTGTPVQFLAAAVPSSDESISGVSWDFGSGSFGAASSADVSAATHTFTTPGTYTVRVQATDSFGLSTVSTQTITVAAAPVTSTSTGTAPTVTPAQAIAPTLKLVKLSVSHGKVKATLLCAFASCSVNANLTTHTHGKGKVESLSAGGHGKSVTVAAAELSIGLNQIRVVTIKLSKAGRQLLARFHKIPATASFRLSGSQPAKTISHRITVG